MTRGEKENVAPAANPLFISSRPFINMQTANIHDPSGCQMKRYCRSNGTVKTVKRGRPKKESCQNAVFRVCETNEGQVRQHLL